MGGRFRPGAVGAQREKQPLNVRARRATMAGRRARADGNGGCTTPGPGGPPLALRISERLGVIRLSMQLALWVGPRDKFRQVLRQAPFGIQ